MSPEPQNHINACLTIGGDLVVARIGFGNCVGQAYGVGHVIPRRPGRCFGAPSSSASR